MPRSIDWNKLLADNPGIDADRLKEWLEASQKLYFPRASRYRYNLIPPFAGGHRGPAAEIGGSGDNIRKRS